MRGSMTRWNPATQLFAREPFFHLVDALLDNEPAQGEEISGRTWTPPVDVHESPEAYMIQAELPGLSREDIDITLENNVLRLSGERKFEKEEGKSYHRVERFYGNFTRSFALPSQVDAERIQASFQEGVLTLTVPKAEKAKPKRISIG